MQLPNTSFFIAIMDAIGSSKSRTPTDTKKPRQRQGYGVDRLQGVYPCFDSYETILELLTSQVKPGSI